MAADREDGPLEFDVLTAEEQAILAGVEHLLAAPDVWAAPSPHILQAIHRGIQAEDASAERDLAGQDRAARRRWVGPFVGALVGAAAAALVAVAVARSNDDSQVAASTVAMNGTDALPGVSGTAQLVAQGSGLEIRLDIPGLPRRDGGDFYQLWVKNCAGDSLVPAGTFHTLDRVTGWVGVSTVDYPIITVTREHAAGPADPLQGSSGDVVLMGVVGSCPS